jgi:gluconolactonase
MTRSGQRMGALDALVAPGSEVRRLATGFEFTEGPIWRQEIGALDFSDVSGDIRRRWSPASGISVLRTPSSKCNGMTLDNDGNLIVCEHVTSSVVRERPDGRREVVASHWQGLELNSPNDVVVARDGSIYFTDPSYGRTAVFGLERACELDFQGVYRVDQRSGDLEVVATDFEMPNGICLTRDESQLLVNDTPRGHIRVFDVGSDGLLSGGGVFFEGVSSAESAGGVDGMKLDEHGNVYVTGPEGIWVISPAGDHLGTIPVPEIVGNLNWGGSDWKTLYICASTSIYSLDMAVSGNRLGYMT